MLRDFRSIGCLFGRQTGTGVLWPSMQSTQTTNHQTASRIRNHHRNHMVLIILILLTHIYNSYHSISVSSGSKHGIEQKKHFIFICKEILFKTNVYVHVYIYIYDWCKHLDCRIFAVVISPSLGPQVVQVRQASCNVWAWIALLNAGFFNP